MRILQCVETLDPRAGGTVEACRLLTLGLAAQRQQIEIATLTAPENPWAAHWPCPVHCLGPSYTRYLYSPRLIPWLTANVPEYDAVIVHNVYRFIGYGAWRASRSTGTPYYLFTHGMLAPWFKTQTIKHLEKTLFWKLAGYRMFRDAAGVLYTAAEEQAAARLTHSPYHCREHVVGLGIADPMTTDVSAARPGYRYLLFLGRITAKKRVDLLIRAFASVYREDATRLMIAGPDEEGLSARFRQLPEARALGDRVVWAGHLDADRKWPALAGAEAVALISHTENFGIALVEALAMGVPVLTTRKVDIWREIAGAHAGFAANDDLAGAIEVLTAWRDLSDQDKQAMRRNARSLFQSTFHIDRVTNRLLNVLSEPRP